MASKHVEDTVEAFLKDQWTATPIRMENTSSAPPADGSAFIIVEFPLSNTQRMSLGTRRYREWGGFRVVVCVPRGGGTGTIRGHGEALASLFRDVTVNGVHFQVPSEPFTDDQSDQAQYFRGAMVVPYWYSYVG